MGVEEAIYAMPAELDMYMHNSIFHSLGFCSSEEYLKQKLAKAEESHRDLALSTVHAQLRLRDLEHKRAKSKEEAVLNAQALKRQVAEGQKLTEQYQVLKDEFSRLQQESSLYQHDRDVFMEAAYEAEDRAAEAEDRAAEAERRQETLAEELEQVKQQLLEGSSITVKQYEEIGQKLRTVQDTNEEEVITRHDELAVHQMVSSAVTAGVCKFLEGEEEASLRALNLGFTAICRSMDSESCGTRARVKFAEMNVQALVQEVQGLRDEASLCRGNLAKAEIEVQMLADENKELRILLRDRYVRPDSSMRYNKGVRFTHTLNAWHHCPQPLGV